MDADAGIGRTRTARDEADTGPPGHRAIGIGITDQVLMSAGMCLISCWLARRLVRAERAAELPA